MTLKKLDYEILVPKESHLQAINWCETQFGQRWAVTDNRDGSWSCFWAGFDRGGYYRFCFNRSEDALLFALKWS